MDGNTQINNYDPNAIGLKKDETTSDINKEKDITNDPNNPNVNIDTNINPELNKPNHRLKELKKSKQKI